GYDSSSWAPVIVNNIAWCTQTNIVDVSEVINDKNNNGQTIFNSGTIIQNNLFKSDAEAVVPAVVVAEAVSFLQMLFSRWAQTR
ncbi:MAG: hypothetical protein GX804_04515, partial [Lentisphaerae bacterium]|nr:hypothetical protein [Lentisphaerota bacterium]